MQGGVHEAPTLDKISSFFLAEYLYYPGNFFMEYHVQPEESERNSLQITNQDECYILSVVTVPPDQKITLNLTAPILFSPKTNRAIQIILENTDYKSKTPLPA